MKCDHYWVLITVVCSPGAGLHPIYILYWWSIISVNTIGQEVGMDMIIYIYQYCDIPYNRYVDQNGMNPTSFNRE